MTMRHTIYGAVWAVHLAVVFGLVSTAFWTHNPVIALSCLIAGILDAIFGSLSLLDAAPESKASRRRNMEWAREADDRAAIGKTQELKRLAHENGLPWWDGEKIVWPEVKWPEEEKKEVAVRCEEPYLGRDHTNSCSLKIDHDGNHNNRLGKMWPDRPTGFYYSEKDPFAVCGHQPCCINECGGENGHLNDCDCQVCIGDCDEYIWSGAAPIKVKPTPKITGESSTKVFDGTDCGHYPTCFYATIRAFAQPYDKRIYDCGKVVVVVDQPTTQIDSDEMIVWSGAVPVRIPKGKCGHYPECDSHDVHSTSYDENYFQVAYSVRKFDCGKQMVVQQTPLKAYWTSGQGNHPYDF